MPEGMEALAEFTLVLQDIATLNVEPTDGATVPANQSPPILVTLWVNQTPATLYIDISKDGEVPKSMRAFVGQSVVWRNYDPSGTPHQVIRCNKTPVADSPIPKDGSSPPELLDKGQPQKFSIDNVSKNTTEIWVTPITNKTELPSLMFPVYRVLTPQGKVELQTRLFNGTSASKITWDQWMEWTTPYQGQRTAAKPGAASTTGAGRTAAPNRPGEPTPEIVTASKYVPPENPNKTKSPDNSSGQTP
jgi:hypothetical protein